MDKINEDIPDGVKKELQELSERLGVLVELTKNKSPLLLFENTVEELQFVSEKLQEQAPVLKDASSSIEWRTDISGLINYEFEKQDDIFSVPFICFTSEKRDSVYDLQFYEKINTRAQELFEEDGINGMYGIKPEGKSILPSISYRTFHSDFFGINPYPRVIDKTAKIWFEIARRQAFFNGNKRSALLTALTYLTSSGYRFNIPLDSESNAKKNPIYVMTCEVASAITPGDEEDVFEKLKLFISDNVELDIPNMIEYVNEIYKVGVGGEINVKSQYE